MIRVLLVDAGGVLFNNVNEDTDFIARLAEHHDVAAAALRREVERRDADYETDARHVHDVLTDSLVASEARVRQLDQSWVDELYLDCVREHTEVFSCLRRLRSELPDVAVALANNEARHWDRLKDEKHSHMSLFDIVGSSWRIGAVKPDTEYFERLCHACGCSPEEALLVDDNPSVIAAAALFGIGTRHLASPEQLPQALASVEWATRPQDYDLSLEDV